MEKKLFIFGDSFCAPYSEDRNDKRYFLNGKNFDSYTKWLEDKYTIFNYADKGMSVFDVVETILKAQKVYDVSDAYCLVILPDPQRFNFKYYKTIIPPSISTVNFNSSNKIKNHVKKRYGEPIFKTISEFQEFNTNIRTIYLYHWLGILNITQIFKQSVLWDINLHYHLLLDEQKRNIIENSVNNNQIFSSYMLEAFYKDGAYPNHFDLPMHQKLFKIITQWVDNDKFDLSILPKMERRKDLLDIFSYKKD